MNSKGITVRELIEELQKYSPNAKVLTNGQNTERFDDVTNVLKIAFLGMEESAIVLLDHKTL